MGQLRIEDKLAEDPGLNKAIVFIFNMYQSEGCKEEPSLEIMDGCYNVLEYLYRLADLG